MMGQHRSRVLQTLLPVCCLIATGCVDESRVNDETVFTYQLWVPLVTLVIGVVGLVLGIVLRRVNNYVGWILIVCGPLFAVGMAPSLFRDRVAISADGFHVRTGIWGL